MDVLSFDQSVHAQRALSTGAEIHDLVRLVDLLPRSIRLLTLRDASKAIIWHVMNLLSHKACFPEFMILKVVSAQPLEEGEYAEYRDEYVHLKKGSRNRIEALVTVGPPVTRSSCHV